jgi:hypothetical protein
MLWQVSWDGECRFYCLLSLKSVNRWDGFWQPFGAVNENKQSLPAGWKFIDDSHRSRWRQIAETLVEERSILMGRLVGSDLRARPMPDRLRANLPQSGKGRFADIPQHLLCAFKNRALSVCQK